MFLVAIVILVLIGFGIDNLNEAANRTSGYVLFGLGVFAFVAYLAFELIDAHLARKHKQKEASSDGHTPTERARLPSVR